MANKQLSDPHDARRDAYKAQQQSPYDIDDGTYRELERVYGGDRLGLEAAVSRASVAGRERSAQIARLNSPIIRGEDGRPVMIPRSSTDGTEVPMRGPNAADLTQKAGQPTDYTYRGDLSGLQKHVRNEGYYDAEEGEVVAPGRGGWGTTFIFPDPNAQPVYRPLPGVGPGVGHIAVRGPGSRPQADLGASLFPSPRQWLMEPERQLGFVKEQEDPRTWGRTPARGQPQPERGQLAPEMSEGEALAKEQDAVRGYWDKTAPTEDGRALPAPRTSRLGWRGGPGSVSVPSPSVLPFPGQGINNPAPRTSRLGWRGGPGSVSVPSPSVLPFPGQVINNPAPVFDVRAEMSQQVESDLIPGLTTDPLFDNIFSMLLQ